MALWIIWLIIAVSVIAAKYFTTRTVARMKIKISDQEARLSIAKGENKLLKSNCEIVKRNTLATQKRIEEAREMHEKLRAELKALEETQKREMEMSKEIIAILNKKENQ